MKIKIDENLALVHKRLLEGAGHDVSDVHEEGAGGFSDAELWRLVCTEGRFFVTLDHDFSDVRALPPGSHAGVLLLRTGHPSMCTVSDVLERVLAEPGGIERLAGCLAVADETRTRFRKR